MTETDIIRHDQQDVGRSLRGLHFLWDRRQATPAYAMSSGVSWRPVLSRRRPQLAWFPPTGSGEIRTPDPLLPKQVLLRGEASSSKRTQAAALNEVGTPMMGPVSPTPS